MTLPFDYTQGKFNALRMKRIRELERKRKGILVD